MLYKKGVGMANLETKELISPKSNFRMASVSKQFTAMCIMLLTAVSRAAHVPGDDSTESITLVSAEYPEGISTDIIVPVPNVVVEPTRIITSPSMSEPTLLHFPEIEPLPTDGFVVELYQVGIYDCHAEILFVSTLRSTAPTKASSTTAWIDCPADTVN